MRTRSRIRLGWSACSLLAASLGAPTLAQAQQTGLLPLHPIKRERVPCAAEDPIYRLYRQQYFGYHPTCWRRFPAGWGCPSPEAPNPAEAFRKLPRDAAPTDAAPGAAAPGAAAPGGANPDDVPLPGDDMPNEPGAAGPKPGGLPPLPPGGRSPFDLDPKPGTGDSTPPARDAAPGAPADRVTPPAADEPRTSGAARAPAAEPPTTPPAGTGASTERASESIEPLLSVPDPTVGPTSAPGTSAADLGAFPPAARAQPTKRPSLLGSLFGGRGARRR